MHGDPSPLPAFSYFSWPLACESGPSCYVLDNDHSFFTKFLLFLPFARRHRRNALRRLNHKSYLQCFLPQSLACVLFDIEGIMQPHLLPYHHLSVVYPVSSEFFCVVFVSRTVTVFSRMYPLYLLYIRSRLAGTILGCIVRNASYGSDHLSVRIQRTLSR